MDLLALEPLGAAVRFGQSRNSSQDAYWLCSWPVLTVQAKDKATHVGYRDPILLSCPSFLGERHYLLGPYCTDSISRKGFIEDQVCVALRERGKHVHVVLSLRDF